MREPIITETKDGWFHISENGEEPNKEENECCYFCGFNKVVHQHHIIRISDGGKDDKNNILTLCPNHHALLHEKKCSLGFVRGIYLLKDLKTKEIIKPFDIKTKTLRKLPISSISNNQELIINGDINHKASIKLKFFKRCKKNKIGVCNEKGVQSI